MNKTLEFLRAKFTEYLPERFKTLAIRFDKSPIATVAGLAQFNQTRASYIAQTSLYGYLKTRMGTRFVSMFEDDVFVATIRASRTQVFMSCLSDLTIHSIGLAVNAQHFSQQDAAFFARYCFELALSDALSEDIEARGLEEAIDHFANRADGAAWATVATGETAFAGSCDDLIRFAPVIDEFKELDHEIVRNSIRFRWRDVREQLRKRIDGPAICIDWQANLPVQGPSA